MIRSRDDDMGRFSVNVELANHNDGIRAEEGDILPDRIRRLTLGGVVDTGATRLVLPESTAQELGLKTHGQMEARYAGGRTAQRPLAGDVELSYLGRSSVFNAVIEPGRESALIGGIARIMGLVEFQP